MIICENCFKDDILVSILKSITDERQDLCPTCKKISKHLYNTDLHKELTTYFEDLLDIYLPAVELPHNYPIAERHLLIDDLTERWHIFSDHISQTNKYNILTSICSDLYSRSSALFSDPVGISELFDNDFLQKNSLLKTNNWDDFVNEIKTKNRFHSKLINFDILEKYCTFIRKIYKAGSIFYRARISDSNGFGPNDMGAPPADKSSEGRANARGITCLYLSDDMQTTLHEVRAGVLDYVSIGKFILKKDIVVVNLRAISTISPFTEGLKSNIHAVNKPHLQKINDEISKTLRRNDSTLDYIPTQYIVDFIKSIEHKGIFEYQGIEYNSTTHKDGYNLAIFYPKLFECTQVDVYDIENLQYSPKRITTLHMQ